MHPVSTLRRYLQRRALTDLKTLGLIYLSILDQNNAYFRSKVFWLHSDSALFIQRWGDETTWCIFGLIRHVDGLGDGSECGLGKRRFQTCDQYFSFPWEFWPLFWRRGLASVSYEVRLDKRREYIPRFQVYEGDWRNWKYEHGPRNWDESALWDWKLNLIQNYYLNILEWKKCTLGVRFPFTIRHLRSHRKQYW